MSPTYTMSAHLCKEIYKSWQTRRVSPESTSNNSSQATSTPTTTPSASSYTSRYTSSSRSPSPEKRSMDSDRSDSCNNGPQAMSRSPSSSWKWGGL